MTNISPYSYDPTNPELVPPEQFYPGKEMAWPARIAFAVLDEALTCLSKRYVGGATPKASKRIHGEAAEWIASNDDWHPFTFLNVCAALGFEPGYIRAGVSRPGFVMPRGMHMDVLSGRTMKQTNADLLAKIDLKAQRKARRGL